MSCNYFPLRLLKVAKMKQSIASVPRKINRRPLVLSTMGISSSTLRNLIADGLFPRAIQLGPRSVGFVEDEVQAVVSARIAGKSTDEIRTLVEKLMAARKTAS
jgi:prophage regulatory protein